jgi:hypothetical protein
LCNHFPAIAGELGLTLDCSVPALCESRSVLQRGKELTNGCESGVGVLDKGLVTDVWKTDSPCVDQPLHQHPTARDHDGVALAMEYADGKADLMESAGQIRPSERPLQ